MSIQGQPLEVTVVACSKLKDTEWISRQDPFVCLEYASTKFRTRTCTDGGRNPVFQEKTVIPLIEGLRQIEVAVWNSNTITFDAFIGSGRIQLHKVLAEGYDDSSWPLQSKSGKYAGEIKVIMHYANASRAQKPTKPLGMPSYAPTANPAYHPAAQYAPPHYPAAQFAPYDPRKPIAASSYPPTAVAGYTAAAPYPGGYPASYPPPPEQPQAYAPQAYPPGQAYPPNAYQPQPYPPPQAQPYPPAPYPGVYPPPPY